MKIDKDIQEAVANEFCDRIDKGEDWIELIGSWVISEMERRQKERRRNPNAREDCQCTASLNEKDPRAELWKYILGSDKLEIPLRHPLYITNPNFPEKLFLEGDARKLSIDQKARLVERMAENFNLGKEEVEKSLEGKDAVVPILSDGCITSICSLHFRAML